MIKIRAILKKRSGEGGRSVGFTTAQVKALTGLSTRQLEYFELTGLLVPSIRHNQGKGHARLYSFRDLIALRVIAQLHQEQHVSLQSVRRAVAYLQNTEALEVSQAVLAVNGDDIMFVDRDQSLTSLIKHPRQLMWILDIGAVTQDLQEQLMAIAP
jgi:DNA-binding transcriptional MerR regulator